MDQKAIYSADLMRSTIKVYNDYCEIAGKVGTLNWAKGTKKLYYFDLTSVQFKMPGSIFAGYIQFEYPGSDANNKSPYESENSVVFNKKDDVGLMKRMYEYIEKRIAEEKREKNSSATIIQKTSSPADEVKKMKELLDMGIITQEEFEIKKKQLLGL